MINLRTATHQLVQNPGLTNANLVNAGMFPFSRHELALYATLVTFQRWSFRMLPVGMIRFISQYLETLNYLNWPLNAGTIQLRPSFWLLRDHQKTNLTGTWGEALTAMYSRRRLGLRYFTDSTYYIREQGWPALRSSADFIFFDPAGRYSQVAEAKGSHSFLSFAEITRRLENARLQCESTIQHLQLHGGNHVFKYHSYLMSLANGGVLNTPSLIHIDPEISPTMILDEDERIRLIRRFYAGFFFLVNKPEISQDLLFNKPITNIKSMKDIGYRRDHIIFKHKEWKNVDIFLDLNVLDFLVLKKPDPATLEKSLPSIDRKIKNGAKTIELYTDGIGIRFQTNRTSPLEEVL